MAGVTEAPFRAICKRFGAGLTFTEMVSARGLHHNPDSRTSQLLLAIAPEERPCAVQLFGSEPDILAQQAARLARELGDSVLCFDLNMGCPVTKGVAKGEGSALMRTPELAASIVEAVATAVAPVPVSVKFRSGWDAESINAVQFAQLMEASGAQALAVHGRTRDQLYHGKADWNIIAQVKAAVSVPVMGSGDVFSPHDVVTMIEATGVDAVMVARGAQGNPWMFSRTRALLDTGELPEGPTNAERIAVAREHATRLVAFAGEHAISRMRKHLSWYTTGMPGATHMRSQVYRCKTLAEFESLLAEYEAYLEERELLPRRAAC